MPFISRIEATYNVNTKSLKDGRGGGAEGTAEQDDQDPELSPPSSRRPSSLETVQHEMKVTNYNGPHQQVVLHESHHIIKNTIRKRMHNVF